MPLIKRLTDEAADIAEIEQIQHQKKVHLVLVVRDEDRRAACEGRAVLLALVADARPEIQADVPAAQQLVDPAEQQLHSTASRSACTAAAKSRAVNNGCAASIVRLMP